MHLRKSAGWALGAVLLGGMGSAAAAYPDKPIKMVIAFAPGGTSDTLGRLVATHLSKALGQPVVAENRPGATGTIGTNAVAKAAPDGYTLLMASSSSHYSAYLYPSVPYDLKNDFAPVAGMAVLPLYIVARPDFPASNIAELVALAKKKNGGVTYASPGSGGAAHLATELFMKEAGIQMLHVPYKGVAAAIADIMGGRVDLIFDSVSTSQQYVATGKLKALGISSAQRAKVVPTVPTVAESGFPGFEATYWMGLWAPAGTPPAMVERINGAVQDFLKSDEMRQRIAEIGGELLPGTPKDFGSYVERDSRRWVGIIKELGLKAD
ncbi:Tripartite tricarboxylate transporter family receptor [Pigmentiphaga humi]|uniref:Tripartite tricarboxylate transporter family receptor n=1 Tax=Pigmentiphaga humi TaxID=2478468 RepID=A0A3P4B157_9BURK|nr:tripartite tricarboxylate transporter substrate binding protein [Pigmentiphaga humi]VCU70024.1 Tripartite tricarboxylate transporter family receptor [Pigmentiphaga humi]